MEQIIDAACAEHLDYLITTDHNTLAPRHHEGWHGDTLVLVEEEVTQPANHLLALNIRDEIVPPISPQQSIDAVLAQGGLAFMAHPFYQGSKLLGDPPIPWTDWKATGFTGMEIWNFTAELYESLSEEKELRPLETYRALMRPKAEVLRTWDRLQQERRVVGLAGLDAHAEQIVQGGERVTLLPYATIFRTLRMHVLLEHPFTGSLPDDRRAVYAALRDGHGYIAFEYESPVDSFTFAAVDRTGAIAGVMGDEFGWKPGMRLSIALPRPAAIRVIRNGETLEEVCGPSLLLSVEEDGCYRVEVQRDALPWIVSNPIYIRNGRSST
ncbi:MAG: hypothetical protein ABFD77_11625 [Thermotogota bacterium]